MSNNKDFLDFILRTFDIIGHEEEKYKKVMVENAK